MRDADRDSLSLKEHGARSDIITDLASRIEI
jgi:hypothetical protein